MTLKALCEHKNVYNEYLRGLICILSSQRLNDFTWEANPLMRLVYLICKGDLTHVEPLSGRHVI